ncbi:nicotinate-nucleotide adenylyltransferase [Psychrobacillus glaciei]|uniref:Probable nicotinate-nucleotide adenylyltransferase n=1 Tax=Psychrobacillus glaciei TaxID=2283160 RepID=A0A5J6SPS4_9BACI|nr:nicotinate-nucleotide adenylyltransferase [Psychrobacillus glaciei]QFF99503.1 nicotinate-nucleotide adenylyltransferase [Psychrobacillus glaciei]
MSKKVGILGGTFNPPHIGHLIIANEVLSALNLDELRFMPNATPPHKKKDERVSEVERLKMVQLAIKDVPKMAVETIEMDRGGTSYTFDTMELLQAREPSTTFFFIIGGDQVEYLSNWYRVNELVEKVQIVGVPRPNTSIETAYPIIKLAIPQIELSSTLIRNRLENGKTTKFLIPELVRDFIQKEKLYEIR